MSNLSKLSMTLGLKFGPVRKGVTPRKILEYVVNDMIMVQADTSIAADPDIVTKQSGMMDAYKNVAHFIAPYTNVAVRPLTKETVRNAKAAVKAASSSN